jgi:hypothetical protein
MSSQEAVHVSLIKVTPRSGKETLGTWWFHFQRGGWTQSRPKPCACDGTKLRANQFVVGAYANQRLNLTTKGKARGRKAKTSNRTWEIRPSGIIGGPRKTWPWWK